MKFYSIKEAAEILGCSPSMVRVILKKYNITVTTSIRGMRLFTENDIKKIQKAWKGG